MAFGSSGSFASASPTHEAKSEKGSAVAAKTLFINDFFAFWTAGGQTGLEYMTGGALPYIGLGTRRQSSWALRGFAFAFLALALGGCAGLGMPFGEPGMRSDRTAAVTRQNDARPVLAKAIVTDQVDAADWETVRRTAEGAPDTASKLDWITPETGSTGTLSIAISANKNGAACRAFATTVNDVRGIRRYRGEACVRPDGRTQLHGLTADDATLL
jgi:hypothetical protein